MVSPMSLTLGKQYPDKLGDDAEIVTTRLEITELELAYLQVGHSQI